MSMPKDDALQKVITYPQTISLAEGKVHSEEDTAVELGSHEEQLERTFPAEQRTQSLSYAPLEALMDKIECQISATHVDEPVEKKKANKTRDSEKADHNLQLVSAKRKATERSGVHSWHPYYAGYSETFVSSALNFLGASKDTVILDPWGGSGTTNLVCSKLGIPSLSLEINPVMATFSAGKAASIYQHKTQINNFFGEVSLWLKNQPESLKNDAEPLEKIFTKPCANMIRSVVDAIPFPSQYKRIKDSKKNKTIDWPLNKPGINIGHCYAFCLSVVFVSVRELSRLGKMANPTWQRASKVKVEFSLEDLAEALNRNSHSMMLDLQNFYAHSSYNADFSVIAADARRMPIRSKSINRIITSPPYLTRIDYAVSTSLELFIFGGHDLLKDVRHQTMGAPVITKSDKFQKKEWGVICNNVLDRIKSHDTKAASTYYWKNIVQYFIDAERSIDEILRVLSADGTGLIVVQNSYFKDVEIPLGEIYVQMFQAKGVSAEIVFRDEVKVHMAHLNTKSRSYKDKKTYYEDFVYFSN